jgi:hypothetical protein
VKLITQTHAVRRSKGQEHWSSTSPPSLVFIT